LQVLIQDLKYPTLQLTEIPPFTALQRVIAAAPQ